MRLRLIYTFYCRFMAASIVATLFIAWYLRELPFALQLTTKALVGVACVAITHFAFPNEYCYYRNLGVRPPTLWAGSLAIDALIFVPVALIFRSLA